MAPEQFEGKEADARADIWAFGAVLYEMVTGQKAFQGKSYGSLVGSILSAEPTPMALAPFTPAWLERLVRRCLAKDPEGRYFSMHDIVLDLRTPPQEPLTAAAKPLALGHSRCLRHARHRRSPLPTPQDSRTSSVSEVRCDPATREPLYSNNHQRGLSHIT